MKKSNLGLLCLVAAYGGNAFALNLDFNPYIGVDAQYNHMRFENDDGARFKQWTPQANGYLGLNINKSFAVEVGYEHSERTRNNIVLSEGERFLGNTVGAVGGGDPFTDGDKHLLELKSRAVHINFVGFYPIRTKLDLIGSAGISWVNLTGYDTLLTPGNDSIIKMYNQTKGILELGGGLKYMLNSNFGMKAMVSWQNRSRLEPLSGSSGVATISARIKNSFKTGVGVVFYPVIL